MPLPEIDVDTSAVPACLPVPVIVVSDGDEASFDAIRRLVVLAPNDVGEKVTCIVQLPLAAIVGVKVAHVPVATLNMAASLPLAAMEDMARLAFPVLDIVTV